MRCQPGDLAIIVGGPYPENHGAVVEVIEPTRLNGDDWLIFAKGRALMTSHGPYKGMVTSEDGHLLPIRPQSDEAEETEDELETVTE